MRGAICCLRRLLYLPFRLHPWHLQRQVSPLVHPWKELPFPGRQAQWCYQPWRGNALCQVTDRCG